MSSIDLVYEQLDKTHPILVFITGKTSTGKTTLSSALRKKYDSGVIELDDVVNKLEYPEDKNRFIEAYQNRNDEEFTYNFVEAVRDAIRNTLTQHSFTIIEGALANTETLEEIIDEWKDSFLFIYLDIKNVDIYIQRLTDRFMLTSHNDNYGLPELFWGKFSPEVLSRYYDDRVLTAAIKDGIASYAADSIEASEARLAKFSATFDHILKVAV